MAAGRRGDAARRAPQRHGSGQPLSPRLRVAVLLLAALAAPAAGGDDAEPPASSSADLAREFSDPLTTLPQIFVQEVLTPESYGTKAVTQRFVVRAIVPRIPRFSLLPFVQLVRPTLQVVTVPTGRGGETRTAFGDLQLFDFAVLPTAHVVPDLYVGVGPVFVFPTATDARAGQGAWQVGPGGAALYKGIPGVLLGVLVQNPISFAYTASRREPVSSLLVQPVALAYVGKGFYVKSADSTWTFGWRDGSPTLLPLSVGIGHVTVREGLPPLNVFVSGEWTVHREHAPVAPQVSVRLGLTMAFPQLRRW